MESKTTVYDDPDILRSNMDHATLLLLSEKDREIDTLRRENTLLKEQLDRERRPSAPARPASPSSTPTTLAPESSPPSEPAPAPTEDDLFWAQLPLHMHSPIAGQEPSPPSTQDEDDDDDYNDCEHQYECEKCGSILKQEQDLEAASDGWANEESASTGWDNQASTALGDDVGSAGAPSWETEQVPDWANNNSNSGYWNTDGNEAPFQCGGLEKWRNASFPPESKSWLHTLHFREKPHTMPPEKLKDIIDQHNLIFETRLHDEAWLQSDTRDVRVDDKNLLRLATRGKEIAQKTIWDHADKYRPEYRETLWPAGWHQVKLEHGVLEDAISSLSTFYTWRQNDPYLARRTLLRNVVPLRHMVCHWGHNEAATTRTVATHLKEVQKFAISLGNKERAMEARRLRDKLRKAVEDSVIELQGLEPNFDEYKFKYHHEQMFQHIERERRGGNLDSVGLPDVVFRAAEAWARRRPPTPAWDEGSNSHWQEEDQQEDQQEGHHEEQQEDRAGPVRRLIPQSGGPVLEQEEQQDGEHNGQQD